jgi:hypothetical protein
MRRKWRDRIMRKGGKGGGIEEGKVYYLCV